MFNDDLSFAILLLLKMSKKKILNVSKNTFPIFNIGTQKNISIKRLAHLISREIGYNGNIQFNKSYPDGTMKKNLNSSKIRKLGWSPKVDLDEGIRIILKSKNF